MIRGRKNYNLPTNANEIPAMIADVVRRTSRKECSTVAAKIDAMAGEAEAASGIAASDAVGARSCGIPCIASSLGAGFASLHASYFRGAAKALRAKGA